jgi:hypothetical protein
MGTFTYIETDNQGSTAWNNVSYWEPSGYPGQEANGDTAVIDGSTYSVTLTTSLTHTLGSLQMGGAASLDIAGGVTLTTSTVEIGMSGDFSPSGIELGYNGSAAAISVTAVSGNAANDAAAVWYLLSGSSVSFAGNVAGSGDTFAFVDGTADKVVFGDQTNTGTPEFFGAIGDDDSYAFNIGNIVELKQLPYVAADTYSFSDPSPTGGATTLMINGTPAFTFASFDLRSGHLEVVRDSTDFTVDVVAVACFAEGTRLRTERGEVAVEDLREGDRLRTAGGSAPIVWIGRRQIDLSRHARPERARPVRIARDAFAPGVPARDLFLSPDHAVFWNGHLVEAKRLINGSSVVQTAPARVTYFHVELPRHDIVFADALPAESYLDTGNRTMFENAGPLALHPDFAAARETGCCAPVAHRGAALAAIRQHLIDRARHLGFSTTDDPALHLVGAGTRIDGQILADGRRRFQIPRGVGALRLRGRSGVPAELLARSDDTRVLGAFIAGFAVTDASGRRTVDLATLSDGFYPREAEGIWTNGDAGLDVTGPCILEITLAGTLPYPHLRMAGTRRARG